MEVVKVFNNELSSLYDVKPPISKAKMTAITKSAIKGIKYYKHIVQSVEKFIQKCRPEYKVPGLYVVDSIVRQSRHQFGADKDVFGPRFVKNITHTFQHLFKCPEEDRSRIIRVLNLWQKNTVFPIEVIQPLLDMGHPNSTEWPSDAPAEPVKEGPVKIKEEPHNKSSPWKNWPQGNEEQPQENKTYAEMSTKNLEMFNKAEMSNSAKEDDMSSSSLFKTQVHIKKEPEETVKFNKKLLDFDYGDEEDEEEGKVDDNLLSATPNALALSMAQNLLSNPDLLRQLQQMTAGTLPAVDLALPPQPPVKTEEIDIKMDIHYSQEMSVQNSLVPPTTTYPQPVTMPQTLQSDFDDRIIPEPVPAPRDLDERSLASVMTAHERLPPMSLPVYPQTGMSPPKPPLPDKDDRVIPNPPLPQQDLDERSLAALALPPQPVPPVAYTENTNMMHFQFDKNGIPFQPPLPMMDFTGVMPPDMQAMPSSQSDNDERMMYSMPGEPPLPPQDFDERQIVMPAEERSHKERSRSRSRERGRSGRRRSRSRSPRRKRSTSRTRSRKNRSRSRERERIREKEKEREKERERRRKGIPPLKKGCVSVCSTTLWLGHVPKTCTEVDISDEFNSFGTILSIDMIPPRGCAYVVMDRRQDANRALNKLKNMKLHGSTIKMAWAPGKGVKGKEFKEYWEVDLGVSYVPFEKIKEDLESLALLEEGGFIDEDTLPEKLKTLRQSQEGNPPFNSTNVVPEGKFNEIPPPPNMVPPPIMPPVSVGMPMVMPHLMQPQFGMHLPGMLPPQAMVMPGIPMGIPPPAPMLMVQQPSQALLGSQPMPMVAGVPPIVPRTVPPVPATVPVTKSAIDPAHPSPAATIVPSATAGDATPTEEEGTSISSPKTQVTNSSPVNATSSQPMSQFNAIMGMHANRPMISVPPPVSAAGTPIPYPPPNVGFSFPPPAMRPPPNAQFPWMQKQFMEGGDSKQPVPPIRHPHMMMNRPPFVDQSSQAKDSAKSNENKPVEGDEAKKQNQGLLDKSQEMVISTDDESSMDIEYSRNIPPDVPPGFPPDFPRFPMNMPPHMRGPLGPMHQGPRFPGANMGPHFPMRIGGPRPMGMHGRMEMEFPPHGPRGPMMPMGPRGPHRNDMHPPPDGRDWYPRDFEGPPFEREMHFRDNWGRDPWAQEMDNRRGPRDPNELRREDHRDFGNEDGLRHDERRDFMNRDDLRRDDRRDFGNRDDSRHADRRDFGNQEGPRRDDHRDTQNKSDNSNVSRDGNSGNEPPKPKKTKSKNNKSLMDDLFKLSKYTKDTVRPPKKDLLNETKPKDKLTEPKNKSDVKEKIDNKPLDNQNTNTNKILSNNEILEQQKRDREARKRSRWGRTLSEERDFQIQKQNEIDMKRSEIELKFQNYQKFNDANNPVPAPSDNVHLNNGEMIDSTGNQPAFTNDSEQSAAEFTSAVLPPTMDTHNITPEMYVLQQTESLLSTSEKDSNVPSDLLPTSCVLPVETHIPVDESRAPIDSVTVASFKEPELVSAPNDSVAESSVAIGDLVTVTESDSNVSLKLSGDTSVESIAVKNSLSTCIDSVVTDTPVCNDSNEKSTFNETMDTSAPVAQMES